MAGGARTSLACRPHLNALSRSAESPTEGARKHRFLIVTGMHRSNTSMLARILGSVGVNFGNQLVDGNESNPYGHFENVPLVRFHEAVLELNKSSWRPLRHREYSVSKALHNEAERIIDANTESRLWGFKVPHATLLLNYWATYQQAAFVFIFRHPREVLNSLFRRLGAQVYYKPYFAVNAFLTYCIYNEKLYDFCMHERQRVYLIHNRALLAQPQRVLTEIGKHLQLRLSPNLFSADLIDTRIKGMKHRMIATFYADVFAKRGRAIRAYERLSGIANTLSIEDTQALAQKCAE